MVGGKVLVQLTVLLCSCHLPLLALADRERLLEKLSHVQCRAAEMRFSLPPDFKDLASAFGVLGNNGIIQSLQNDLACGFGVGQRPDGSAEVSAAYTGCYVRVEDEDYVMTIMIEYIVNGEVEHRKRDVKCPIVQAMDAPSAADCAAIQLNDRVPCGNSSVSREVCDRLECCFSPGDFSRPCYFGKKVNAYCTSSNQFVVAISKDVTKPPLILDLVNVVGVDSTICPGKRVLQSPAFVRFDLPYSCGKNEVSDNAIIYEINIEAGRNALSQNNVITRDSTMKLTVRCSNANTGVVPLIVEVFTQAPPPPVLTSGPLSFELRIAKDARYSSYYQDLEYPVISTLKDPVNLEVRVLNRKDPNLVLILNNCWATPSTKPNDEIKWPILVDSCPYEKDEDKNYLTQLSPVDAPTNDVPYPSHYQRFIVRTFVFVDQKDYTPLTGLVYFHCSASVCTPSATDSCSRQCSGPAPSGHRKKRTAKDPLEVMVTKGPVVFKGIAKQANVEAVISITKAIPIDVQDFNKTIDPRFIGAKDPIDDLTDGEGSFPRIEGEGSFPRIEGEGSLPSIEGNHDPHGNLLMWMRGAAAGCSFLAVTVTVFGICRCRKSRQPIMHTVTP